MGCDEGKSGGGWGGTEAKSGTVAIPGLIDFHYESLLIYDFMAYKKGP